MNIALICSDRGPCPPVKGGAIQLLISRVAPLLAKRHSVTVYSISDPSLAKEEYVQGVRYLRFSASTFLSKVSAHIRTQSYDIIQTFNRPHWIPQLRKKLPTSRYVLSLHNLLEDGEKQVSASLKEADHILTVSRFVAKDTVKKYPRAKGKITPVYTGVDLREYAPVGSEKGNRWRSKIRKKYRIDEKVPVILFVGRLVPYKGCHLLVNAMKKIQERLPEATLLVVGSKWYGDKEKDGYWKKLQKAAKKLHGKVVFTSYIPVDDIPKYFAAADLFVCASQWKEPLARVHYEAMASGLPIITTKRGGNAEVIRHGKNGYVIEEHKNKKPYAKFSIRLLSDRNLAERMGRMNRKLAEEKYRFDRVAEDWLKIYHGLDKKGAGRRS